MPFCIFLQIAQGQNSFGVFREGQSLGGHEKKTPGKVYKVIPFTPSMKNLLAIAKRGDENSYQLAKFYRSLPKGTRRILDSAGFIGGLEAALRVFRDHRLEKYLPERYFSLLCLPTVLPTTKDLATDYFSSIQGAELFDISDELRIKIGYEPRGLFDRCGSPGTGTIFTFTGSITEMVQQYNQFTRMGGSLLTMLLNQSQKLRESITKKSFWRRETRIVPTFELMGLETRDGRYLLNTPGPKLYSCGVYTPPEK